MQFSTLNAYPSAVPVPKEIFADVLHAVPLAASITILVGKYVLLGFFKLLQPYRPHRPQVRSGYARRACALP
jgi:hypothetical protein